MRLKLCTVSLLLFAFISRADEWVPPVNTTSPLVLQSAQLGFTSHYEDTNTKNVYSSAISILATPKWQFSLGLPAYQTRSYAPEYDGFGQVSLFTKFLMQSPSDSDSHIMFSPLIGMYIPTGKPPNNSHGINISAGGSLGMELRPFVLQTSLGFTKNLTQLNDERLSMWFDLALQYHLGKYLWPEVELNIDQAQSYYRTRTEAYVTPGIVAGRFPIGQTNLLISAGYQRAFSRLYYFKNAAIASIRLIF